jgi:periplasmic divalent cation tolerance protein
MKHEFEFVTVSTSIDSDTKAEELAKRLVEERLAACVHIVPIRSTYRWKGKLESASEYLLNAKTKAALVEKVIAFIRELHPYEVPEIIATPIVAGYSGYLSWIQQETC